MKPGPAIGLSVLAGALLVSQSRVNAVLSVHLRHGGAPLPAAAVSFTFGTVVLLGLCLVTGALRPARQRLREDPGRWWFRLGGLGGAALVGSSAAAVPVVGAALTSVFVVTGQTAGSMAVDTVGLGPSGKHPPTAPRVVGALLAVGALVVGAFGHHRGGLSAALLVAVVVAGALVAGQQAVNGRLQQVSGSSSYAALISFVGGATVLVVASLGQLALGKLHGMHTGGPWWMWCGGIGGATYITLAAMCVRVLGVLRLSLSLVLGQLGGGLVLDLVWPTSTTDVTWSTYVGVALTLVALVVAGLRSRPAPA